MANNYLKFHRDESKVVAAYALRLRHADATVSRSPICQLRRDDTMAGPNACTDEAVLFTGCEGPTHIHIVLNPELASAYLMSNRDYMDGHNNSV